MSFVNKIVDTNINGINSISESTSTTYKYSDYMSDMLIVETAINNLINSYSRTIAESALECLIDNNFTLTEAASTELIQIQNTEKANVKDKLKQLWRKIVEMFFNMVDSIYTWIYEKLFIQKSFIDKHKDEITENTLIYGKINVTINDNKGNKVSSKKIPVSYTEITSYEKIFNPNMKVITDKNELKKYIDEDGSINKESLHKYYQGQILGDKADIAIEDINKNKNILIKNIENIFDSVKNKNKRINEFKIQKEMPENATPEQVKEFQSETNAYINSLREYNKVCLEYCSEVSSILRRLIKSPDKKKEDK